MEYAAEVKWFGLEIQMNQVSGQFYQYDDPKYNLIYSVS